MSVDNAAFLALFWDLASDDAVKRVYGGAQVVDHVRKGEQLFMQRRGGHSVEGELAADTDYTLKRLIRGLGSSRDSARHGFATCLCELLSLPSIQVKYSMTQIEELTKIKSSLKPHEQRDLIFGKLFAYLALIRSGRLAAEIKADPTVATTVAQTLLQLHAKKDWLREVTSEAILSLMTALPAEVVASHVVPALRDGALLPEYSHSLGDYSAWQLQLAMGLEHYAYAPEHAKAKAACLALLPTGGSGGRVFSVDNLPLLHAALANAAARFPKIHKLWDYCLGEIFGLQKDRTLPTERLTTLGQSQIELLQALVRFLDSHFLPASHERRAVAFRLAVTAVQLVPVELIPMALSKACIRQLVASRTDKKKVLYALAGSVVGDLVHAAGEGQQSRMSLANWLVSCCGASFDAEVGVDAVQRLLEGLGEDVIKEHVGFLLGVVSASASASAGSVKGADSKSDGPASKRKRSGHGGESEDDGEGDSPEEEAQAAERAAVAAINALAALAANTKLACRGKVCSMALAALVRVSIFGMAPTEAAAPDSAKGKGKGKDKDKGKGKDKDKDKGAQPADAASHPRVDTDMHHAMDLVEGARGGSYSPAVTQAAAAKLLSVLALVGASNSYQLDFSARSAAKDKEKEKEGTSAIAISSGATEAAGPTCLQQATAVVSLLRSRGLSLLKASALQADPASAAQGSDDENDDDDDELPPAAVLELVLAATDTCDRAAVTAQSVVLLPQLAGKASPVAAHMPTSSSSSVAASLSILLQQLLFQVLAPPLPGQGQDEPELGILRGLAEASLAVLDFVSKDGKGSKVSAGSKAAGGASLEQAQLTLLGYCFKALSLRALSRGVRHAVRDVWVAAGKALGVGAPLVREVMDVVTGVEMEEDEDDDDDDEEEEDDDDDKDEDDDDSGSDQDEEGEGTKSQSGQGSGFARLPVDADGPEASSDSDSDSGALMHSGTPEADAALAAMIDLRRKGRKQHLLDAKRHEFAWRARAVDILEVSDLRRGSPCLPPDLL